MPVGTNKVTKNKRSRSVTHIEIQALLSRLKEIVPNMPRNRKLSKLEIIQHVIDYIVDLQSALDNHPPVPQQQVIVRNSQIPRQPLGVLISPSNCEANACATLESLQVDKIPPVNPEVQSTSSLPLSC